MLCLYFLREEACLAAEDGASRIFLKVQKD